jgi:hypothetical protein
MKSTTLRLLLSTAIAAITVGAASGAQAANIPNGISINGIQINGMKNNGTSLRDADVGQPAVQAITLPDGRTLALR